MPSTRSSASHVPQDGQRTQKQQPGTKPTTAILPPLPDVVKREIVSYLPMADAKSLALANWEWKTYAESHLWASMLVSSEHDPWTYISESDRDIKCQKVQKSIRQRLESHPDRVASVKRLVVHDWPGTSGNSSAIPGTPEDSAAIVRLVAPTVETLEESSICQIHTSDACAKATIPHRIFAQQPFPRLKTLKTHFDRNWSTSLPGVLRTMPNLGKLFLWGESDWEDLAGRLTDWPPLDRVFELILEGNVESTNVVSTLLPLCPSLRKLELRLGDDTDKEPHEYDREGISAMISVILNCATRESLTIGHEVNTYFMAEFEPGQRDPILTGHLPNLKHLNLMSKVSKQHCCVLTHVRSCIPTVCPVVPSCESFTCAGMNRDHRTRYCRARTLDASTWRLKVAEHLEPSPRGQHRANYRSPWSSGSVRLHAFQSSWQTRWTKRPAIWSETSSTSRASRTAIGHCITVA
jgi:hypothetical protein